MFLTDAENSPSLGNTKVNYVDRMTYVFFYNMFTCFNVICNVIYNSIIKTDFVCWPATKIVVINVAPTKNLLKRPAVEELPLPSSIL